MAQFCESMNNYNNRQLNEKGCASYSAFSVSTDKNGKINEDLGLVALDSQLVRDNNSVCNISLIRLLFKG